MTPPCFTPCPSPVSRLRISPVTVVSCMLWHVASAGASWPWGVGRCLTFSAFHRRGYGATTHKEGEAEDEFGFVTMVSGTAANLSDFVTPSEPSVVAALWKLEPSTGAHSCCCLQEKRHTLRSFAAYADWAKAMHFSDPPPKVWQHFWDLIAATSKLCNLRPLPQRLAPAGRPLRFRQCLTVRANLQTC